MRRADRIGLGTHAAGDDHLAVFIQRGADRLEGLGFGAVEETAGIHDDRIGAGMRARELVALGAQPRQDALAVDERLRAAETDERNPGRGRPGSGRNWRMHDLPSMPRATGGFNLSRKRKARPRRPGFSMTTTN